MKFLVAAGVVFWCLIFVTQELSSSKLKVKNHTEESTIVANSSPVVCAIRTTVLKNELPSKAFLFYESGERFLSVFVQVDLPDDGKTYYLTRGSVNIKGQKNEKATTFQSQEVLLSNCLWLKVPTENVHAKLVIDQMTNNVVGLGKTSEIATPETENRTPDKVEGRETLELSIALELESVKEK